LLLENEEGFLAGSADALVNMPGPGGHLLVHPVTAGIAIDNADAFADGIKHKLRLLRHQRAFERQEIAGIGEDGIELPVTERFHPLFDAGAFDDVAMGSKSA
jgi:hypothetical protein